MTNIKVKTNDICGKIKPMHAVNNAPVYKFASDQRVTNMDAWKAAGIPYGRTHDASIYYNYGGEHVVDVTGIFPNFDKDENDPESYDFQLTDEYLKVMLFGGTKPFYRLGSKIEHWPKKYSTLPPKDFHKWARICEHIIRHYNEGWADGYEMNIEYWEIWNEADLDPDDSPHKRNWGGTAKEYYEFYNIASKHLKSCFPNLKIGGPSMSHVENAEWLDGFFKNIEVKPDFFSWHLYDFDTNAVMRQIREVREMMNRYGLEKAESILNEWNYVRGWEGDEWIYSLKQDKGIKGSSYIASVMCGSQYEPVDMLMYYDARPSGMNGLFSTDLICNCLKGYYPFKMFNELYMLGNCAVTECDDDTFKVCAAVSDNAENAAIMLSYFDDNDDAPKKTARVSVEGFTKAEIYLLDQNHDMDLIEEKHLSTGEITLDCPLFGTYLVKLEK